MSQLHCCVDGAAGARHRRRMSLQICSL